MAKICIGSKVYDVQNDRAFGFVVSRSGKIVARGTRSYEAAVAEFRRIAENASYAAREAGIRSAGTYLKKTA